MTDRVLAGDQAAAEGRAVGRSDQPREGIGATELRDVAEAERLLAAPAETIHSARRRPGDILTRNQRIDAITPQMLQDVFKKYFPLDRYTVVTLMPETGR